jgi:hypothetical protein
MAQNSAPTPRRKPWMSEDYRMAIFDAVGMGQACLSQQNIESED